MSSTENTATEKRDVYARVTSQIINAIEEGVGSWRMPWHTSGRFAFSPINVTSKKPYRGINTLCIWAAAESKGYESDEWGTYRKWQERGAQVRKGEKATLVVFWKFADAAVETEEDGEETTPPERSRLLFSRGYSVFNASQVDGCTPKAQPDTPVIERIEKAEAFFRNVGANVRHGGNRAYYAPASDHIQMPPFPAFDEFVAVCRSLHEGGLSYSVQFNLAGDNPHVLITASGTARPRNHRGPRPLPLPSPVPAQRCRDRALEVEWFLPENSGRRNSHTSYWGRRQARYRELSQMAEEHLQAELEYWRELELLSGQREHFKPGRTEEALKADDEVVA